MCTGTHTQDPLPSRLFAVGTAVTALPRCSSANSRYLQHRGGTSEYQDVAGCTEGFRAKGRANRRAEAGGKPQGRLQSHGAVLFSRRRLTEAPARTGASLPSGLTHPPSRRPPKTRTHPALCRREETRSRRFHRRSRYSLFGLIYHQPHRSSSFGRRGFHYPSPPLSPFQHLHAHTGHTALGEHRTGGSAVTEAPE